MLQTLRRRLARWYLLILGLIIACYSLGTFALVREVITWGVDEANHHLALPFVGLSARPEKALEEALERMKGLTLADGEHIEVLDTDGRVRASRGSPIKSAPAPQAGIVTVTTPEPLRILTVPLSAGPSPVGYVRAAHSLALAHQALLALALTLVGLLPVALLVAWAGGDWLAGKAVAPIEAAIARERRFTRDASHELRTPLAVIQSHAELALGEPGAAPVRDKLEAILKTTRKLSALVADLLTLSRQDAGIQGQPLRFALDEVIAEEIEILQPLARERGIAIVPRLAEDAMVEGEPGRLAQTVRNLIDNALRYAAPDTRVTVTLGREDGAYAMRVHNLGAAIPAEERVRIFDRFHRAPAALALNPEGSGLGLAISRAIAEAHGGELVLEHSGPDGTTFRLTIPAAG